MSRLITIDIACCCGSKLQLVLTEFQTGTLKREREAFDAAHQICRERERPLVMWGGDQA